MREFFLHWIYPFQAILSNLVFAAESPLPSQDEGIFFTLDLSISGNIEQFWFFVAEKPPSPKMREVFLHWNYTFQSILSNFGYCGRKAPQLSKDEGNFLH